ncbi:BQ2448_2570 [Microbotryum intermedium]|uniref:BQ2448_2570 protein n=1 Tax=Microbotryum intermedium TaxID=269621 RepID=A0A238F6R8_9BASI|nr:BQ2448_2570 [Microbotryum intermedium]
MAPPSADSSATRLPMPVDLAAPASSSDEGDWSDWSPSEHSTEDDNPNDEASFDLVQSHEWSEQIDDEPAFLAKTHTICHVDRRSERSQTPSHDGSSVAASVSGDERMRLSFPDPLHANKEAFVVFDTPSEGSNASLVGQDSDGDGEDEHPESRKTMHQHSEVEYSFLLDAKESTMFDTEAESPTVEANPPMSAATQQVDIPLAADATSSGPSSGPSSGCAVAQWVQSTVQASRTPSLTALDQGKDFISVISDPSRRSPSAADPPKLATGGTPEIDTDSPGNVKDEGTLADAESSTTKHSSISTASQDRPWSNESPSDSQASLRSVDSNLTILANSPSSQATLPAVLGSPAGGSQSPGEKLSTRTSKASAVPFTSSLAAAAGDKPNCQVPQTTHMDRSEVQSSTNYADTSRLWVCRDTSTVQGTIPIVLASIAFVAALSIFIVSLVPTGPPSRHAVQVVSDSSTPFMSASGDSQQPSGGHNHVGPQVELALSIAPAVIEQVGVPSRVIEPVEQASHVRVTPTKESTARSRQSNTSAYRMVRPFKGNVEGVVPRSDDARDERCHCQCSTGRKQAPSSAADGEDLWAQPSDTDPLAAFKALVDAAQDQARTFAIHASHTTLRESKKRIKKLTKEANRHAQKLASEVESMGREAADINAFARRQSVKMSRSLHDLFHRNRTDTARGRRHVHQHTRIKQHLLKLEQRMKQAMELLPDRSEQLHREGKKAAGVIAWRLLEAKWMVESWRNGEVDLLWARQAGFKIKNCDEDGVGDSKQCMARRKMAKERGHKFKAPGRSRKGTWA